MAARQKKSLKHRRITVGYSHYARSSAEEAHMGCRIVPYLRLRGFWLDKIGFKPESKVRITVSKHRLVMTLIPDTE